MDKLIDFLEENKTDKVDEKAIADFKEKLDKPIEYKEHLKKISFDKKWFLKLDDILIELGYRALDADIEIIKKIVVDYILHEDFTKYMDVYNLLNVSQIKNPKLFIDVDKLIENPIIFNNEVLGEEYDTDLTNYDFYSNTNSNNLHDLLNNTRDNNHIYDHESNDYVKKIISMGEDLSNNYFTDYNENKIDSVYIKFNLENKNTICVEYLINNVNKLIDRNLKKFMRNENDIAVEYCIKELKKRKLMKNVNNNENDAKNYAVHVSSDIYRRNLNHNRDYDNDERDDNEIYQKLLEHFAYNRNDKAVDFYIRNCMNINFILLSQNTSKVAMAYCIENLYNFIMPDAYQSINDERIVKYIIQAHEQSKMNVENKLTINWKIFSKNQSDLAVAYLIQNPDKIDLETFSSNSSNLAVEYLIKHPDKINWEMFSQNKAETAVRYCLDNPYLYDWDTFSLNEANLAVSYLLKHPDEICWANFSMNNNPMAVDYCMLHLDRVPSNYTFTNDIISKWKIRTFNTFNWLQKSGMRF